MSKIAISGASTGTATFTIESPATSTNRTLTLPDNTGTIITQNSTPAFASTIGVGGATAAASGAGITFPATQSASSNANTLDDYEQGTWTPSVTFGGAAAGQTGTFVGFYTKIGNQVFATCTINLSAKGSSTGTAEISGLPFVSVNESDYRVTSSSVLWVNLATNYVYILGFMENNYSKITLYAATSATAANTTLLTNSNLNDSSAFRLSITYQTA